MHQDQVGHTRDRVPFDRRLQAAEIVIADNAGRRLTASFKDAEAGVIEASAGLRVNRLTCTREAVPDSRGVARAAGGVLPVNGSPTSGAALNRDCAAGREVELPGIPAKIVFLLSVQAAEPKDQQHAESDSWHFHSSSELPYSPSYSTSTGPA